MLTFFYKKHYAQILQMLRNI